MGVSFTISTDVVAAVAKWASGDLGSCLHVVAFRDGRMEATDGMRLVSVPIEKRKAFGVGRAHLLAACAAQTTIHRDDMEPQVNHDLVESPDGFLMLADGPHGERELRFTLDGDTVTIDIDLSGHGAVLRVPARELSGFPESRVVAGILREAPGSVPVTGYVLQPCFLAAIDEVNTATGCRESGVRCIAWGKPPPDGKDPIVFSNAADTRFAIMPMKMWAEGS